jgi:hypothetical protein
MPENNTATVLLLVLGGAFFMIFMVMRRKVMQTRAMLRESAEREEQRPRRGTPGHKVTDVRDSLDELFIQLQEFSRDTLAKLDTKMRLLNQLLSEADAKIAELKRLQEEAQAGAPGTRTAAESNGATEPKEAREPLFDNQPAMDPMHQSVFDFADKGMSLAEISRQMGLQRAEVEVILGLRELKK